MLTMWHPSRWVNVIRKTPPGRRVNNWHFRKEKYAALKYPRTSLLVSEMLCCLFLVCVYVCAVPSAMTLAQGELFLLSKVCVLCSKMQSHCFPNAYLGRVGGGSWSWTACNRPFYQISNNDTIFRNGQRRLRGADQTKGSICSMF